jgi:glyoxylase-like metal-dependent hydrolase (beta-lactamase superfamily II)
MNSRVVVGAALVVATWACGSDEPVQVEDFHFIQGTFDPGVGPDGNTVVYRAEEGLVVVDAGRHMAHSQKILDYAAERGLPITAIINTHWHLDHSTGNQDLVAVYPDAKLYTTRAIEGALEGFLAAGSARTEEALKSPDLLEADRARMERGFNTIRGRISLIPDVPVDARMSLLVRGRELELNTTDHAVTESDVWIWDPATSTVVAGDLVTLPAPYFDTACPTGWLAAFDAIEAKPYERVIPGHGFPMTPEEFRMYRTAFVNLVTCAEGNPGATCVEGWLADAGSLLDKAAGKDFGDREWAKLAVEYYVDEILRSEEKRAEFCRG